MIITFFGLLSYWRLGFSLLSILGWSWIPTYLSFHTQTFHPWILSYLLSYQSLTITFFYPTHLTITHDLTSLSIRRRRGSVLDHFVRAFIHLLDFRFNIFHDGRAWEIADLLVMMLSFWQLARWVLIFVCPLHFEHWSSLFYSSVSLVLSAWCHDAWSYLALPIWGWAFSLHDGWAYLRVQ